MSFSKINGSRECLTNSAGGVNQTLISQLYQVKIFMLSLLESKSKKNFWLATEIKEAGKFDDLIVRYPDLGTRLLQAKFKCNPTVKLNYQMFFTDKNFDLRKYYQSFVVIKERKIFEPIIDLIICTNNSILDCGQNVIKLHDKNELIYLRKVEEEDVIFKAGVRYKFSTDKIEFNATKMCLEKRFANARYIKEFMEKFLLIVELKSEDIDNQIEPILRTDFNLQNVKNLHTVFQNKIMLWIMNQPIGKTNSHFDLKCLESLYDEIRNSFVFQNFKLIESHGEYGFKFRNVDKFDRNFKQRYSFSVITHPNETSFAVSKCYQAIKDKLFIIIVKTVAEEDFELMVKCFQNDPTIQYLIVEYPGNYSISGRLRDDIIKTCKENPKKQFVFITESDIFPGDPETIKIIEEQVMLGDLVDEAAVALLKKKFEFQSASVELQDLIGDDPQSLSEISLKEILDTKTIGTNNVVNSKYYDHSIYIPRTLVYQIKIKKQIIEDRQTLINDELAFSQSEFEELIKMHPHKNIHLLDNSSDDFLLWIQTEGSISELKKYSEIQDGVEFPEETIYTELKSRVFILVDVAGKGKSYCLNHSAEMLKKKFPMHWIVNITLNNYTNYFQEHEMETQEEVLEFMSEAVLDLKSNLEETLFKDACKRTGKVFVMLDGLDEVASDYDDKINRMIDIILGMKVSKLFISTRPELGEILEDKFRVFKYYLMPFKKTDQTKFLTDHWKRNLNSEKDIKELEMFADQAIDHINKSISDHEKSFTGIPLITRLIAEILMENVATSKTKILEIDDLFKLFSQFVEGKFRIYSDEKLKMDSSKKDIVKIIQKENSNNRKLYEILALNNILNVEERELIPEKDKRELTEDDLTTLRKIGLILTNNQFIHKTFGEYFLTTYLVANLGRFPSVAKLFFNSILYKRSHNIVRNFLNSVMKEKLSSDDRNSFRNIVRGHYKKIRGCESVLYLVTWERHIHIFDLIFNSMISRGPEVINEVEEFLLNQFSILRKYFIQFNDDLDILDQIQKHVGMETVKKILKFTDYGFRNISLLMIALENEKNALNVLQSIQKNFHDDSQSVRSILNFHDENGYNFLQFLIVKIDGNHKGPLFFDILHQLQQYATVLPNFTNDLYFLITDASDMSLIHLMAQKRIEIETMEKFLTWFKKTYDTENLLEMMKLKNKRGKVFWTVMMEVENDIADARKRIEGILNWIRNQHQHENPDDVKLFEFLEKLAKHHLTVSLSTKHLEDLHKNEVNILIEYNIIEKSKAGLAFCDSEYFDIFGAFCLLDGTDGKVALILNLAKYADYTNMLSMANRFKIDPTKRNFMRSGDIFKQNQFGALMMNLVEKELWNIYVYFVDELLFKYCSSEEVIADIILTKKSDMTVLHIISGFSDLTPDLISKFIELLKHCKDHFSFVQALLESKTSDDGKSFIHMTSSKGFFKSMLDFVITSFGEDFCRDLLLSVDNERNLFLYYLIMKDDLNVYLDAIRNRFGQSFLKDLLLWKNKQNQNFLYGFDHYKNYPQTTRITKILNFLHSLFGSNVDFFVALLDTEDAKNVTFLQLFAARCESFNLRNQEMIKEKSVMTTNKQLIRVWLRDRFEEHEYQLNFTQHDSKRKSKRRRTLQTQQSHQHQQLITSSNQKESIV